MKIAVALMLLFFLYGAGEATLPDKIFEIGDCGRFLISDAAQLAEIQRQASLFVRTRGARGSLDYLAGDFVLAADIFLADCHTPIGDFDADSRFVFSGSFDGAGFAVRGLSIDDAARRGVTRGLFGKVCGAEIRNLTLADASLRVFGDYCRKEFSAGLLAGEIFAGIVENVKIAGAEITARAPENSNGTVGGLVGKASNTRFENIRVSGLTLESEGEFGLRAVGGIAGFLEECAVENSRVLNAKISARAVASGGVAGETRGGEFLSSGVGFAVLRGAENIGGFVGLVRENAVFERSHAVAEVFGGTVTGGFAGRVNGAEVGGYCSANHTSHTGAEFSHCRAFAHVESDALAGGFVGRLAGRSRVANSHAHATVISHGDAGGFVAKITNASRVEFSTAIAAVYGNETAAGFAAIISDIGAPNTITSSAALGNFVGSPNIAHRFAARLDHNGINNCHASLGMVTVVDGRKTHVIPNPFSFDGGDFSVGRKKFGGR